jgi:ribosomal protein S18 acetylase RimI-like enzyme
MSVVIVPISIEHIGSFRASLDVVAREKKFLALVEAPSLEQVETFVRANIEKGIAQVVAVDSKQVVGWADIVPAWAAGVAHRGSLGMGVLASYRGQGLGRALLRACIARAWAAGLERIDLEVRTDNLAAIRLYESTGFQREGIRRSGMRIDGVYSDTLQMGLLKG